jgi:hemerythrin superfamily protein
MSTDAIVMPKDDHQEIRRLFHDFQAAGNATATKAKLATRIIEALRVHALPETEVMNPEVRTRENEFRGKAPQSPAQPSAVRQAVGAVISF